MEDFTKKDQVKRPHKTILGHPKHVLHLVPSPNAIAQAFNVIMQCIGPSAPLISDSLMYDITLGPHEEFYGTVSII